MMNEVSNINEIEIKINYLKQQTAMNIIEIGNQLIKAKEQVAHGEWENWLNDRVNFSNTQATRFMRTAKEFPNPSALQDLGQSKVFALLSLPEEQRQPFIEEHQEKDLTTREWQKEINELKEENKRLNNQETKVIEKEVIKEVVKEVIPSDYEDLKSRKQLDDNKEKELERLRLEKIKLDNKVQSLINEKNKVVEQLPETERQSTLVNDTWEFVRTVERFIKDIGGMVYLTQSINELPRQERMYYERSIQNISDWSNQIKYNLEKEKENE